MKNKNNHRLILETIEMMLEIQLKSVKELIDIEINPQKMSRTIGHRRKSLIDLTIQLLTDIQRPIHVDELVKLLMQKHNRQTDRDSLSSALLKKDKKGILVQRVAPATFALRKQD